MATGELVYGRVHDPLLVGLAGGELLDDTALPGNQDAIGQAEDLRQIGRNHHHGDAAVGEFVDDLVEIGDRADIDAAGRLIEYHELGNLSQRPGNDDFLLIAAGQFDHLRIGADRPHLERLDPGAAGFNDVRLADDLGLVLVGAQQIDEDVLADRHGLEETFELAILGDIGNAAPDRLARGAKAHRHALELDPYALEQTTLKNPHH